MSVWVMIRRLLLSPRKRGKRRRGTIQGVNQVGTRLFLPLITSVRMLLNTPCRACGCRSHSGEILGRGWRGRAWENFETTRTSSFGTCTGLSRRGLCCTVSSISSSLPFLEQALRGNLTQRRLMEDVELRGSVGPFDVEGSVSRRVIRF